MLVAALRDVQVRHVAGMGAVDGEQTVFLGSGLKWSPGCGEGGHRICHRVNVERMLARRQALDRDIDQYAARGLGRIDRCHSLPAPSGSLVDELNAIGPAIVGSTTRPPTFFRPCAPEKLVSAVLALQSSRFGTNLGLPMYCSDRILVCRTRM